MNAQNGSGRPPDGPSPLRFVGLGLEMVAPVLMGLFGGQWLDRRLGTAPWLLLAGVLAGAAAGGLNLYRRIVAPGGSAPGGPS